MKISLKRAVAAVVAGGALLAGGIAAPAAAQASPAPVGAQRLTSAQRADLLSMARDTWRFFQSDVDPVTHLPLDNIGPGETRGSYTSAANIGTYLWAVTSAYDLKIIDRRTATREISATLAEVAQLKRSHGFLYQWYDTGTAQVIPNPGTTQSCADDPTAATDNCSFLSAVDNGWYASGLIVVRNAFPELRAAANRLIAPMDFSIFYDNRAQSPCNVNADVDNQPTGQMYGGYYVGTGPAGYHNGALYSDPRIAMYVGMGLHQMPGDVWWRTWRTLPPKRCATDPDFSWQGQGTPQGYWTTIRDPQSGKPFTVWEGHYTYPGTGLTFLPTYNGGMFEALMALQVVPETAWGPRGFGLADQRAVQVQMAYAAQLGYPVWGMSPSSTPDDTGGYSAYGAQGLAFPTGQQLAQGPCASCSPSPESAVTPHASFLALTVAPQQAYQNIKKLQKLYPGSYARDGGFYDAVSPSTGSVGHRRLVLDQSMIMASLDNALNGGRLQSYYAQDPVGRVAKEYLEVEKMSL
ncbi:hypothetical protein GCM10022288_12280 [Gryllotalpicola kribbensis]|uniref:Glycoamylase-like domain-containing protein n=1 Tax=Gryllotalpicola kribbensis TaxID=993084 RepID=A0ABP8APP8_9MICO